NNQTQEYSNGSSKTADVKNSKNALQVQGTVDLTMGNQVADGRNNNQTQEVTSVSTQNASINKSKNVAQIQVGLNDNGVLLTGASGINQISTHDDNTQTQTLNNETSQSATVNKGKDII